MNIDNYAFAKVNKGRILFRGFDAQGNNITETLKYTPKLYIKSQDGPFKSIYGDHLKEYQFESIPEANAWKRRMKDSMIDVYGDIGFEAEFISSLPKTKPVTKDDLNILYYDIETTTEHGKIDVVNTPETITLISTYSNVDKKVHIFSYKSFNDVYSDDELISTYDVVEHQHDNEQDMLMDFIEYWIGVNPHIISGWNIDGFDNIYIYNRISKVLSEATAKMLSPFGQVYVREYEKFGKQQYDINFYGIASYDYLNVYDTYTFGSVPNMKLDTIAEIETGARKVQLPGKNFRDSYENHWDVFVKYSIRDTILVNEIDKSTDLISVALAVSYLCGCNLSDSFGTVRKLDVMTYNFAKENGLIIPPNKDTKGGKYLGAYVKEPKPGKYEAVASFDLTSLYPHVIKQFNISPESLVKNPPAKIQEIANKATIDGFVEQSIDLSGLQGTPYAITPNGSVYDQTEDGIVKKIMVMLYNDRKTEKKASFQHWQNANDAKEELERRGLSI